MIHRPGRKHINADTLSCSTCQQCGIEPDHVLSATITQESISLPTWTKGELTEAQRKDTDIQQVTSWISSDTLPTQCSQLASHTIQALWAQRKQLCLKDGLLYRKWYDFPGHESNPLLQLLLPFELVNSVLKLLHDNTASGGHLGNPFQVLLGWTKT